MAGMTEDEARKKWCPHTRQAAPVDSEASGTAGNRYGMETLEGAKCIASECMAWRSAGERRVREIERRTAEPGSKRPDGEGWGFEYGEAFDDGGNWVRHETAPVGFCGLAGSPTP